jgi:uncharacterized protein YbcC (UPF0753/DUF2309 family)
MTPSPELLRIGQVLCLQLVHGFGFVHYLELLCLQKYILPKKQKSNISHIKQTIIRKYFLQDNFRRAFHFSHSKIIFSSSETESVSVSAVQALMTFQHQTNRIVINSVQRTFIVSKAEVASSNLLCRYAESLVESINCQLDF